MPRISRKTEELQKAAVHVSYEIEMLGFSAEHLSGWHSSPMDNPVGNEKKMALESFLLHFRNLRAFLCPSLQTLGADDVLASEFLGMYDGSDVGDPDKLKVDKERLDKMLPHLTYSRPDYIEGGDHGWDSSAMLILIYSELQKFLVRLSEEQRAWFPTAESLNERQHWAQAEIDQRGSTKAGL
jgi:hypothetical protein